MEENKEVFTNMLDALVLAHEATKEYSSYEFFEKYKVHCSDTFDGFIPEGIMELAEAAGATPVYERCHVLDSGMVRKVYSFEYKGLKFYGGVDAGKLEEIV